MASRELRLQNKVVLITGAGSGIGRASALLFAAEGARIICADVVADSAEETVGMIADQGFEAISISADVRLTEDANRMIERTVTEFGALDIVFNNAGISVRGKLHELTEKQWDDVIGINLKGIYQVSKAAIPYFLDRGIGNIINTASTFGLLASPSHAAYCASKGGVIMLTKQMALDYGPAVRVNCICPGATDTELIRRNIAQAQDPSAYERGLSTLNRAFGRLASATEIAYAALFLASDESSFVTGHALVVDGGQTIDA